MIPAAKYLLEASLSICVVYLLYALLFKGRTFFQLNRFYLVGGLVASFFIPLISLPTNVIKNTAPFTILSVEKIETEYVPMLFESNAIEESSVNLTTILVIIYALGVTFFLLRFLAGIWTVLVLKRRSVKADVEGTIYFQESLPTFSFFNIIFARPDVDRLVLDHERIHIRQMHWIDVLLVELTSIALWFNPILIYFKRAIKAQHEFLADQGVLKVEEGTDTYMTCLVNTAYSTSGIPVTSPFASHSIKNRIIMMTKTKTPRFYKLLYFLIVPAVALLLFAFQDSNFKNEKAKDIQFTLLYQSIPTDAPIDLKKLKITYPFGEKFNPVTNKMQNHTGMDFVAKAGENVMATADGIVVDAGFDEIKGNFVVIRHSDQIATQYFHMRNITVKKGVTLRKGEVIGFVGSTGLSIKDHLHYEVLKGNKAVDPIDYLPKELSDGC
jgi:hypothetical protein